MLSFSLLDFGFSIPNKSYANSFGVFIFGLTIFENRVMENVEKEKEMQKETLKEYTRRFCEGCSNTQTYFKPPTDCQECLDAFVEAVDRLCTPKPSTDFTAPKANPCQSYLLWNEPWGCWYEGFFALDGHLWVGGGPFEGPWESVYTHWLPMPPAPITHSV